MKGKTKSGFAFDIPKNALDDMRLIEAIRNLDSNPMIIMDVVDLLLGENKQRLYDHVKEEDGRIPASSIQREMEEIFQSLGKTGKN